MRSENQTPNKGFTLVEMIVVLTILGILLSLTVAGMLGWQDWADYNRQSEYAETIFLAAQSKLTELKRGGQLETVADAVCDAAGMDTVMSDLSAYQVDREDGGTSYGPVWQSDETATLCYVKADAGDYSRYLAGETTSSATASIVFTLISDYIYDSAVLDGAISIELTPDEGQVFSVCFSDMHQSFVYTTETQNDEISALDRRQETCTSDKWGYYGVTTLSVSADGERKRARIIGLKLKNEDTLNLSFSVSGSSAEELDYTVVVYDRDTVSVQTASAETDTERENRRILSFTLSGAELQNYDERTLIPCEVTRYSYDAKGKESAESLGEYGILAWIDDDAIRIVLDAADLQATTALYEAALGDGLTTTSDAAAASDSLQAFTQTLSFHRFGVDAEQISCTVQASGEGYTASSERSTGVESVYFASVGATKTTEDGKTVYAYDYTLENGRHLYNVRYVEDLEKSTQIRYSERLSGASDVTAAFQVTADIDWAEFASEGSLYYSDVSKGYVVSLEEQIDSKNIEETGTDKTGEGTTYARYVTAGIYPSVGQLRYGDSLSGAKAAEELTGADGEATCYTISGLTITADINNVSFLYVTKKTNEDGTVTEDADTQQPVGLFAASYGTLEDLTLEEATVSGVDKVGAFIGVNYGSAARLTTRSDTETPSTISGQSHVGGVIGCQAGVVYDPETTEREISVTLSELTNEAQVSGSWYVGGILGDVTLSQKEATAPTVQITIEDCANTGVVQAVNPTPKTGDADAEIRTIARYIGGVVGKLDNQDTEREAAITIQNCTSVFQTMETELASALTDGTLTDAQTAALSSLKNGVYVGGIVGYNAYGTILNCRTEVKTDSDGTTLPTCVAGAQYVGGIVGYTCGAANGESRTVDETAQAQGANTLLVLGDSYVGGIAGCNAAAAEMTAKEATITNFKDTYRGTDALTEAELAELAGDIPAPDAEQTTATVQSFRSTGAVYASGSYAGGLIGYNGGTLTLTEAEYTVSVSGGDGAGGLIGYNGGVITEAIEGTIQITGTVIGGDGTGGVIGIAAGAATISDMQSTATVTAGASGTAGGILGRLENVTGAVTLTNCTNSGAVTAGAGGTVGGILGRLKNATGAVTLTDCENSGAVTAGASGYVGGILGGLKSVTGTVGLTSCTNSGTVAAGASGYAGGILGWDADTNELSEQDTSIGARSLKNCINVGDIDAPTGSGIANSQYASYTLCQNYGVWTYLSETTEETDFAGISQYTAASMRGCFDLSGAEKPLAAVMDGGTATANYYINSKCEVPSTESIEPLTVSETDVEEGYAGTGGIRVYTGGTDTTYRLLGTDIGGNQSISGLTNNPASTEYSSNAELRQKVYEDLHKPIAAWLSGVLELTE